MGTVNIAELKDQLSAFLHRVRAGEELVIRDRNLPIAKIVPVIGEDGDQEELLLVASGHMTLPAQQLDQKRFWSMLGHKRDHSHLRTRAKRQRSQASAGPAVPGVRFSRPMRFAIWHAFSWSGFRFVLPMRCNSVLL
jgi:prevent-host-death family protein